MKRILAATNNRGKLKEFGRILVPLGFEVVPYTDIIGKTEIEENGKSFEENSEIKARCIYDLSGEAVIADDSGLCVDALGGRPGVYSARYGGEDIPFEQKIDMLCRELEGVPDDQRTARFVCDICYIDSSGKPIHAQGKCEGYIGYIPRGDKGFGYDPIFYVGDKSLSQMTAGEKDAISHRGAALRKLAELLNNISGGR